MNKNKEIFGFSKIMLLQCVLLYIGIWGGLLFSPYIFIAVAGYTLLVAIVSKTDNAYYHLFFLLPFTVIFKLTPEGTSVFAYLMIVTAVILMLRRKRVHATPIALIALFSVYAMIGMKSNYTTVGKMIAGLFLLYVFVASVSPENFKNHILAYSLGLLGSSIIGTMKESWENVAIYFTDMDYVLVNGLRTLRFTGLNYDPNYYSIGIIIAIFLCMRLFFQKEGNRVLLGILIASLIVFGFISYSKMYLLTILLLAVFFVFDRIKSPKRIVTTFLGAFLVVALLYQWATSYGYMEIILERLSGDDISTGRFDIWKGYLDYFGNSPMTVLLGDGLGAPYYLPQEPHNAYIDLIFFLGIVGGILFLWTISQLVRINVYVKRRKFIDIALTLLFLIMIGTLHLIRYNEFMFYCIFLWISNNMSKRQAI